MWYRTYTSELYRQLSQVDLTRSVYIKHFMLPFVSRVSIKSLPWIRVLLMLECGWLLCYGNVFTRPLLSKWRLLLWDWPVPDLMWAVPTEGLFVKFEGFTPVSINNAVFWDVAPYISSVSRRFGGLYRLLFRVEKSASEEPAYGNFMKMYMCCVSFERGVILWDVCYFFVVSYCISTVTG
jgi:hypothetical protein